MRTRVGTGLVAVAISVAVLVTAVGLAGRVQTTVAPPVPGAGPVQARLPARSTVAAVVPRVDYERQIKPILAANCLECHSQDKRKSGLSLAGYADLLEGGKNGPIVWPGDSARSAIVHRVTSDDEQDRMPFDASPLTSGEITLIKQWIDQGARPAPTAAAAPLPWAAPLALTAPPAPALVWPSWNRPLDRQVAAYLSRQRVPPPRVIGDAAFARRAYLDIWGLLPPPDALQAFIADVAPGKRGRLVAALLSDTQKYAEHWMSFWNDLLRNEDGYSYFSDADGGGRQSITNWLLPALESNTSYDRMIAKLLNPTEPGDPAGFIVGVNWRGETSAAVTPWMQASQNTAQVFMGVNFKCNACHDSFVSKWKLRDAYGLAAFFSPEGKLQLFRCDIARNEFTEAEFFVPDLRRPLPSNSLADRRATAAAIFTDPRNGRVARTLVNRVWTQLMGRGIVPNSDEMDGRPWSPEVLDWLASDFVTHGYDLKHLISTIVASRTYQMPAVKRNDANVPRDYLFRGPEVRRMSAEQFADAVGSITGEWGTYAGARGGPPAALPGGRVPGTVNLLDQQAVAAAQRAQAAAQAAAQTANTGRSSGPATVPAPRTTSDAVTSGVYAREFRSASTLLTRALGRPLRDQVTSVRPQDATTLQALELVNGEILTNRLIRGARRLVGEMPAQPVSRFNGSTAGRTLAPRAFDVDVSGASRLWILVTDTGSNAPERVLPVFLNVQFVSADGAVVSLSALTPTDASGLRGQPSAERVPMRNGSRLVYDVGGRGFGRLRGTFSVDNSALEIGSTLNPSLRFYVFDTEPNMSRLLPPSPELPLPSPPPATTVRDVVDRIYWSALGRRPTMTERQIAEAAVGDPARPGHPLTAGVADLLWAVMMTPEFHLLY